MFPARLWSKDIVSPLATFCRACLKEPGPLSWRLFTISVAAVTVCQEKQRQHRAVIKRNVALVNNIFLSITSFLFLVVNRYALAVDAKADSDQKIGKNVKPGLLVFAIFDSL